MKNSELKLKNNEELKRTLSENRKKLVNLKFDAIIGKLKNVKKIKETKKENARILTILSMNDANTSNG